MKPEQSPFPLGWWGTSLENVGLEEQRPSVGTYGRYEFANLPELPIEPGTDFSWLKDAPCYERSIGTGQEGLLQAFLKLKSVCEQGGVALPRSFQNYMQSIELYSRIRSNTDCYLDLSTGPVPSPVGDGVLVRFLADSQGCIFWYLYIPHKKMITLWSQARIFMNYRL